MSLPGSRIRNISNSNIFLHNNQDSCGGGDHSGFSDYYPVRRFSTSGPASNPNKQSKTFKVLQWLTDSNNLQIRTGNDAIPSQLLTLRQNHAQERRAAAQKSHDQINHPESASTSVYRTTSLQRLPQNFQTRCNSVTDAYNDVNKSSINSRPPINFHHQPNSHAFISKTERLTCSTQQIDARACEAAPPSPRRAQFSIRQPKFDEINSMDKPKTDNPSFAANEFNKFTLYEAVGTKTRYTTPPRKLSISSSHVSLSNTQNSCSNHPTKNVAGFLTSNELSRRCLNKQIPSQHFRMLQGLLGEADEIMDINKRNNMAKPLFVDTSYIPKITCGYTDF